MMSTGKTEDAVTAVREKLWPTLKMNWLIWPGLTAVNLSMVPPPYRILFINFCSLGWSAYLSNIANTLAKQQQLVEPPPGQALA